MLVSLSSYCQYPTVKTIGKDTVVIMTVKQGQDINQKFLELNDTISKMKSHLENKSVQINTLVQDKTNLDSLVNHFSIKTNVLNDENKKLREIIRIKENDFIIERRNWAGWMFFSFVVTVLVGALK